MRALEGGPPGAAGVEEDVAVTRATERTREGWGRSAPNSFSSHPSSTAGPAASCKRAGQPGQEQGRGGEGPERPAQKTKSQLSGLQVPVEDTDQQTGNYSPGGDGCHSKSKGVG